MQGQDRHRYRDQGNVAFTLITGVRLCRHEKPV